jgi:hypothetical protein
MRRDDLGGGGRRERGQGAAGVATHRPEDGVIEVAVAAGPGVLEPEALLQSASDMDALSGLARVNEKYACGPAPGRLRGLWRRNWAEVPSAMR